MWHEKSAEADNGAVTPDIGYPVVGIPESHLGHESESQNPLRDEEVFERNFESKPIRVIEGLLATAAEFEESDIAQHLMHEVGLLEMVKSPSEKVIEALQSFVDQQAEATGDDAWSEVGRSLSASGSGSDDLRVGQAVMAYIEACH